MYIQTPAQQTYVFLMCIGFGFILGLFYDFVRMIRKSFSNSKRSILLQDILYCVISTFAVFCFLLCCNDGEIRFFVLFGLASGWVIYYFTFGSLVVRVTDAVSGAVRRVFKPIKRLFRFLWVKSSKIKEKISKKPENKPNNT